MGGLGKAEEFHTKALTIRLNLFGENHSDVTNSYHNLGALYRDLGNLGKGEEFYAKAYGNLGNLLKSEEFYTKALTIF